MTFKNLSVFITLLTLLVSSPCFSLQGPDTTHKFYGTIDSLMQACYANEVFNGSISVSKDNAVIYHKSFGYTDGSYAKALREQSVFKIGSVAKEFNAIGIMLLIEQKMLSLEDPISKFDLGLPEWSEKVLVKHLLSYTSGLPKINYDEDKTDQEVFARLRDLEKLNFSPGTAHHYNNNSVYLQKRIIEKVSGKPYAAFVRSAIITPLNLTSAVFDPSPDSVYVVQAFDNSGTNDEFYGGSTSGWLHLSNADLHRYLIALHHFEIISKESLITLFNTNLNGKQSALGFSEVDNDKILMHYHHGSSYNFESIIYYNAELDLFLTLTTNNKNFKLGEIGVAIENIVQNKVFEIPKKSVYLAVRETCYKNVAEGIRLYHSLKDKYPSKFNFANPNELDRLGTKLIQKEKQEAAIEIYKLMIKEFPENSRAYKGYPNALVLSEQQVLALKNYERSLELDPEDEEVRMKIEELSSQ